MTPAEHVEAREFTYVSAHYRDPVPISEYYPLGWKSRAEHFVVLTGLASKAKAPARLYCDARWGTPEALHFYPRNYIAESRALVDAGRFVTSGGAS